METQTETGCCPKFDPAPWDGKEVRWIDKAFVKDHVTSLFHIPINFGSVVKRSMGKIKSCGAQVPDNIMLADENSLWGCDLFFAVNKELPDAQMEHVSGEFLTKAFEGPYKDAPKWAKSMEEYVKEQGKEVKKIYFWYTTCPKCAKVYGKNYTVLFAQV